MRRLFLAGSVVLALAPFGAARADERDLEREVKAAYLYKFGSYVEWPPAAFPAPSTPLTIGVLGDEDLADALAALVAGRKSSGRAVEVVRLRPGAPLPAVHILFVGGGEEPRIKADVRAAAGKPVLIVTETAGALAQGSMINFVVDREHVRFEVGLGAAGAAGLTLSSRLLSVAESVTSGRP